MSCSQHQVPLSILYLYVLELPSCALQACDGAEVTTVNMLITMEHLEYLCDKSNKMSTDNYSIKTSLLLYMLPDLIYKNIVSFWLQIHMSRV
jgi:hypothetical protein